MATVSWFYNGVESNCYYDNSDGGVITDSILTDETDLNQSAESTLQSPAFRRITISDE